MNRVDAGVIEKSSVQYAYAYPQYYVLRQDDEGQPWYTQIQNWFQNIGGGGGDSSSEGGDGGDASADAGAAATAAATKSALNVVEANRVKLVEKSDKFVYLTPASTTVLNPEKRFFLLPEQQKIFGSISGPALNPVYSLQPLLSRSTSSSIVSAEPAIVVPENNVPNVVPVQPVIPEVEQPNLLRSRIDDALKAANEAPENRVAPVNDVQTRAGVEVDDEGAVVNTLPVVAEEPKVKDILPSQFAEPFSAPAELNSPITGFPLSTDGALPAPTTVAQEKLVAENAVRDIVSAPVVASEIAKVKRDVVSKGVDINSPLPIASSGIEFPTTLNNNLYTAPQSVLPIAPVPSAIESQP